MKPVLTLLGKEFRLFFGDKTGILITFMVPFALIYIFGNIFSGGGDDDGIGAKIPVAALNASGEVAADELIAALEVEESLEVIRGIDNEDGSVTPFTPESIRQGIVDRRYNFALVVPEDYLNDEGVGIRLEFYSNPRNQIETQMVNGLVQKAVFTRLPQLIAPQADRWQAQQMGEAGYQAFRDRLTRLLNETVDGPGFDLDPDDVTAAGLVDTIFGQAGDAGESNGGDGPHSLFDDLLTIDEDQVYGKEVSNPYLTRMIGGYAIMFLLFATTASASSLFRERDEGLFLRLLSMPVKRTHILWSKYLFNVTLGVMQALVLFLASSLLFDIDVFGHFPGLLVVCLLSASACTAFGMLLAAVVKTPQQAQGLGTLLILGMTAMSGAWVPLEWMPPLMQAIGKFSLVYWGIEGFRGALWEGLNVLELSPYLGVLALWSVVPLVIAAWRFRVGRMFQ